MKKTTFLLLFSFLLDGCNEIYFIEKNKELSLAYHYGYNKTLNKKGNDLDLNNKEVIKEALDKDSELIIRLFDLVGKNIEKLKKLGFEEFESSENLVSDENLALSIGRIQKNKFLTTKKNYEEVVELVETTLNILKGLLDYLEEKNKSWINYLINPLTKAFSYVGIIENYSKERVTKEIEILEEIKKNLKKE